MILWTVVVPVKGTPAAKSRFGGDAAHRALLAEAMSLDTVAATLAVPSVHAVVVVTSAVASAGFRALGARVVIDTGDGLNAAIRLGLAATSVDAQTAAAIQTDAIQTDAAIQTAAATHLAVLLGDLPALQPDELEAALKLAETHSHAYIPDAAGSGTTLITAARGRTHAPAFGAGSAESHRAAGYTPLELPATSGLRLDVDTADDLAGFDRARLGPRTRAALG